MKTGTRIVLSSLLAVGAVSQMTLARAEDGFKGESQSEPLHKKRYEVQITRYDRETTCKMNPELKCGKQKYDPKTGLPIQSESRGAAPARAQAEALVAAPALINSDFSLAGTTASKAANWLDAGNCGSGWGTYTRVAVTNSVGAQNYVMKLTGGVSSAAGCQTVVLNQDKERPINVVGWAKGENIARTGSGYGAFLIARFILKSGDSLDCKTLANIGTFDWRYVGVNSYSDCYVEEPIASVKVVARLNRSTGNAYFDNLRIEDKELATGVAPIPTVSLVFDDGYLSTFTKAYPILSQYNIPASAAVVTNVVGTSVGVTYDNLWTMVQNGWDVLSHSVSHADLARVSTTAATNELRNSQTILRQNLQQKAGALANVEPYKSRIAIQDFVWPYGSFNTNVMGLAQQFYRSGRTANDGLNNAYGIYPWTVVSWTLQSSTSLDTVAGWLSDGCNNNRWVLMMGHTVDEDFSDEYNISSAFLDKVASLIRNGFVRDGSRTVTVNCPTNFFNTGFNIQTYSSVISSFGSTVPPNPK